MLHGAGSHARSPAAVSESPDHDSGTHGGAVTAADLIDLAGEAPTLTDEQLRFRLVMLAEWPQSSAWSRSHT